MDKRFFSGKLRKILGVLISIILFIQQVTVPVSISAKGGESVKEISNAEVKFLKGVELVSLDNAVIKKPYKDRQLKDIEEIDTKNKFGIVYSFEISNNNTIKNGDYIYIDLPSEIEKDPAMVLDFKVGNSDESIGTLTYDSEKEKYKITFNEFVEQKSNVKGTFEIQTFFNEKSIGYGGKKKVRIDIDGLEPTIVDLNFKKDKSKAPVISKDGQYNYSENTVDWTIKVDCKDNAPINGGSIQEILGDYQSIDFSFIKFYNNEVKSENEFKSGNLEASYDNKFTYTFDGEISGVKIIKLTSKIKDNFPKGSNLKNTAKLYIDKDYINEASKEVQTNVTWIDKSGYYDSSNKTINWTINVKCNGKVIDDFKLKDIFDSKEQELVAKSIFISNNDDGSLVDNASTGDGEQFSITGKLSKDITITYKTKVSDSVLKTAKHQDLGNRAEITGTDIPKNTYADTKVGVEPELLTKTGEFIPSKGTIKWTIVVNKNELELSNATIKDIIPDGLELGKEYVEATDEVVQAIKVNDDVVQCTVNSNNELVYEFEDRTENSKRILEGKHTITYTTKIKDYAKTCIKDGDIARFTNKVTLTTDETEPILKEATIDCKPNVIKKDGKYDYKNNLVKWTITINKDKVNCLKNIVIKDAIPDGQKIVKIDDEYFDVSNSNSKYKNDKRSINYDESTKTITYQYLDEQKPMDDYDVFSYYTEITDNSFFEKHSPNYVGQTETKRVYNDAILTGEDISQVTSKGECPVDVSPIYKSAEYQDKSNVIKWTIAINRNCRDFGDVTVVDELNKALTLQTDSIKVYKISSQDELNKYNVSNADEKSKYIDDTITEDQFLIDGNKLELLLKDVKDTYILEFLTTISENLSNNGRVSNKAYIKTGDNVEETGEKTVENIRFTVGKAAGIGETGELIVNKIADNSEKTPLSGAKFELRDRFGNLVGESKVTGKDGKAVFTDLKFGVKYKITEVEPPEGYEIDTENCSKDFTIDDNADVKKLEFTFVNKSIKGSIKVVKKSADTNEFLKGAKFKVYKDDGDKKFDASKDQDFGEMTEVDSIKKPGIYEIKDLPCGDYWVKETFPPSNYSTSNYSICNEAQKVTIKDSKEVQVGNSADNIFYDSLKKGTVKLTKVDKDYPENKLTGAEFKVYEDKDADGKPDNTNSFVKLEESKTEVGVYTAKLRVGKYVLKERKAPEGFIVAEGYTKFEVTEGKDTIISNDEIHKNFINQCKKGTVKLTKVDKDYPDNKLTGAEFKVYEDKDADGQPDKDSEVVIMKESETGIYTASLRIGKYVLEESKSPEGFIEDEGYTKFEVIANQEIEIYNDELTKTFMDEEGIGNLIIKVKDKNTGSPIKGAHIDIFDENSKKICDEYTDENREVVTENLKYGSYIYKIVDVPEGYEVDETSKEVIVKVNEIEEAVSLYKDKEPIIEEKTDVAKSQKVAKLAAKTGDNAKLGLLILLAGISLVVITLNLKKKRKVQ